MATVDLKEKKRNRNNKIIAASIFVAVLVITIVSYYFPL